MKNNRSLTVSEELSQLSTDPPPENTLFWRLWEASESIAHQALETPFVQGIANGNLDPVAYGRFNVSDAYYCFHGADDYRTAASKTEDPLLKAFLMAKNASYVKYNNTFPNTWAIKDATSIVPTSVTKAYSDFETSTAKNQAPIYTLIAMLPCEYLWAWLGNGLSPPKPGNLYADWITGNDYPDGAYKMGNFLVEWQSKHELDESLAMNIYRQAMTFEQQNFAIATESLGS